MNVKCKIWKRREGLAVSRTVDGIREKATVSADNKSTCNITDHMQKSTYMLLGIGNQI